MFLYLWVVILLVLYLCQNQSKIPQFYVRKVYCSAPVWHFSLIILPLMSSFTIIYTIHFHRKKSLVLSVLYLKIFPWLPQNLLKTGLKIAFCRASQCHLLPLSCFTQTKQRYLRVQEHFSCFLISYSLFFSFSLALGSDFHSFITTIVSNIRFFITFQSIKFLFGFQTDAGVYPNFATGKKVKSQIL